MAYPTTLLGKVAVRRNLKEAWEHISRYAHPLSHGMSEQTIQDFRANSKKHLENIRDELLSGNYQFGQVRAATLQKDKKKAGDKRPLRIADIRDRVVQRAMARELVKHLEKPYNLYNPASYAYLEKKRGETKRGVQPAIKQLLRHHQEGCSVIFEADIIKFFDTVNVDKLLEEMIIPALPDNTINNLLRAAFNIEIGNRDDLPEEDWELFPESDSGLPQGGYLSPLFSNVYLSLFDQEMLKSNFRLIRYADDFIVMCKSTKEAERAYEKTISILEGKLDLKLHQRDDGNTDAKTRIVKPTQQPIQFLGVQFNGTRIWPAEEKRKKFIAKLVKVSRRKTVINILQSTRNLVDGWVSAYSFTDIEPYMAGIDQRINKHLWLNLSRLGWSLKPKNLSQTQRGTSGVLPIDLCVSKHRDGLSDRELFEKYWTN